jgi:spermidine synthase
MDPPPPIEAAGSSLLYSSDFYREIRQHLNPGGIVQQWYPGGKDTTFSAVTRSIVESFPYVRVFKSVDGWGYHFLMSGSPIPALTAQELLAKMPTRAQTDLAEWYPSADQHSTLMAKISTVLGSETNPSDLISSGTNERVTDDRPFNEYFWFRRSVQGTN